MKSALLVVLALMASGCGRDFDALFDGDAGAGEGGHDGGGDGSTVPCDPRVCGPSCGSGAACNVNCNSNTCNLGCAGCNGQFHCSGTPDDCAVACTHGAICDVTCDSDNCSLQCTGGSECTLTCGDRTKSCDIQCDGVKKTCNDRVVTCNRDCPN